MRILVGSLKLLPETIFIRPPSFPYSNFPFFHLYPFFHFAQLSLSFAAVLFSVESDKSNYTFKLRYAVLSPFFRPFFLYFAGHRARFIFISFLAISPVLSGCLPPSFFLPFAFSSFAIFSTGLLRSSGFYRSPWNNFRAPKQPRADILSPRRVCLLNLPRCLSAHFHPFSFSFSLPFRSFFCLSLATLVYLQITHAILSSRSQLDLVKAIVDAAALYIQFSFLRTPLLFDRCRFSALYLRRRLYSLYSIFFPLRGFSSRSVVSRGISLYPATFTAGIIITFSPPMRGRRIEEGRFNYFIAWPATATSASLLPSSFLPPPTCPSWYRTRWDARRDWRFINIAVLTRVSRCLH